MKLLIDGDSFLYKVGFAFEELIDWGDGSFTYYNNIEVLKKAIDKLIGGIIHVTGIEEYELWLTPSTNFRDANPLGYKQNRVGTRKPEGFKEIKQYLVDHYNATTIDYLEADDVVVYKKNKYPSDYMLVAQDKDVIYQCEGTHYNYNKDKFVEVDAVTAKRFKYLQCLAGDTVDGYKGVPGIGMKRAAAILEDTDGSDEGYWLAVVGTYISKGLTEEDAINTMRLADMTQWDGEKINLFTP